MAPGANPPVCRIMDYGKFKFDAAQRAKESRRKAVHVGIKEMKYRPKIGPGDFETKTRQVAKFLEEGHKVKITIMFRGREVFHPELGKKILDRIADEMDGMGKSESVPRLDGRNMVMVLAPDKRAKQSAASRGPGHDHNGSNGSGPKRSTTAPAPVAATGAEGAGQDENRTSGAAPATTAGVAEAAVPVTEAPVTEAPVTEAPAATMAAPEAGDASPAPGTIEKEG